MAGTAAHPRLLASGLLVLAWAGCGADPGGSDAVDAGPFPTAIGCTPSFGESYVVDVFEVLGDGYGFDLDGDGRIDNALANVSSFYTQYTTESLAKGTLTVLLDFTPSLASVTTAPVAGSVYFGTDAQTYVPETARYDGTGTFLVPTQQFDVRCNPTASFMAATDPTTPHQWLTSLDQFNFVFQAVGDLHYQKVLARGSLPAADGSFTLDAGLVATICNLSRQASPFPGRSLLDVVTTTFYAAPDIDVNGDGLDRLITDGTNVIGCITGQGVEIDLPSCVCDPRITDGFSQTFHWHLVPARIVGTRE
jgi:hypothetical protein